MFDWSTIRSLSNGKIIASTSVWIFIVPALLKVINTINSGSGVSDFDIVSLPTNFLILYFVGVSFFLGAMVYFIICPSFIKNYENYSDFSENRGNHFSLQSYLKNLNVTESNLLKDKLLDSIGEASSAEIDSQDALFISIGKNKSVFTFTTEKLCDVFWVIHYFFLVKRLFFIWLSIIFYILGFLGLGYMFFHNLLIVLNGV